MTMLALETSVIARRFRSSSSIMIFDLVDETLEIRDVPLRELAVAAEVRGEGSDAAGEETIEETLAFVQDPFVAGDQRRIAKTPGVLLRVNSLLLQQAVQQRLDGCFLPVLLAFERGNYGFRREGAAVPENLHDDGLSFGNAN